MKFDIVHEIIDFFSLTLESEVFSKILFIRTTDLIDPSHPSIPKIMQKSRKSFETWNLIILRIFWSV